MMAPQPPAQRDALHGASPRSGSPLSTFCSRLSALRFPLSLRLLLATGWLATAVGCAPAYYRVPCHCVGYHYCPPPPLPYTTYHGCPTPWAACYDPLGDSWEAAGHEPQAKPSNMRPQLR